MPSISMARSGARSASSASTPVAGRPRSTTRRSGTRARCTRCRPRRGSSWPADCSVRARRPRSRSCSPRSARSTLHPSRSLTGAQWLDSLELQPEARQLISLLVRTATYVDPDAMPISADAAVSQLQMAIAPGVRYIDGGWQTLVDGLLAVCESRGVRVETKSPVVAVRTSGGGVEVDAGTGHWTAKAAVIAGLGPANATSLLGGDAVWGDLGEPATAACLDLGLTRPPSHPVAFGFVRPAVPLDALSACRSRAQRRRGRPRDALRSTRRGRRPRLARRARCRRRHQCFDDRDRALPRAMNVAWTVPTASRRGLPGRPPVTVPGHDGVFVAGDWVGPVGLLSDATAASAVSAAHAARSCATTLAGAR